MIELVAADRCIACDKCIAVCPTNVFDRGDDGIPVIARHDDCQTCFQCEANCPVDALFVAPATTPHAPVPEDLIGSYRERIGWGKGRTPASRRAIGPPLGSGSPITS